MKLNYLIQRLQEIRKQVKGNPDVVIDLDEHGGHFSLGRVKVDQLDDSYTDNLVINLKSSSES